MADRILKMIKLYVEADQRTSKAKKGVHIAHPCSHIPGKPAPELTLVSKGQVECSGCDYKIAVP